jgi:diadenosine tetraphosphate (Ap4A) HIT family hydrolase
MPKILTEQTKIVVWQNSNYVVTTPSIPHICKFDGGHLIVSPVVPVGSINDLSDELLLGMVKLVGACEKALMQVLGKQGIEIPFCNNQDNGNWAVFKYLPKSLHFHVYGRAKNSTHQTFGQAIYAPDPHSGFYDDNVALSKDDIDEIGERIDSLIN